MLNIKLNEIIINNDTSTPGRNFNTINNETSTSVHNSYYNLNNVDNDTHLPESEFDIPDNNLMNDSALKDFATECDAWTESDIDSYAKIQDENNVKTAEPKHDMTKIGKNIW